MINKDKIMSHFILGHIDLIGIQTGWRFYPIQHKEKTYVVEINSTIKPVMNNKVITADADVYGIIYEFKEKPRLLHKNKGKKVFSKQINYIDLDDNSTLYVKGTTEEEFMCYYPQIIEGLFKLYDNDILSQEKAQKVIQDNNNWDGIIP